MANKIQAFEQMLCPGVYPYDHGFPTHYVFDQQGKLRWSKTGAIPAREMAPVLGSLLQP
jgi:hypothetical protein